MGVDVCVHSVMLETARIKDVHISDLNIRVRFVAHPHDCRAAAVICSASLYLPKLGIRCSALSPESMSNRHMPG
jgi:hypothetical protein